MDRRIAQKIRYAENNDYTFGCLGHTCPNTFPRKGACLLFMKRINIIILSIVVGLTAGVGIIRKYMHVPPISLTDAQPEATSLETASTTRDILSNVPESNQFKARFVDLQKPDTAALSLRLLGTAVSEEGGSVALIEENGNQRFYRVGDRIQQAFVKKINRNTVVLDINGKEVVLTFDADETKTAGNNDVEEDILPKKLSFTPTQIAAIEKVSRLSKQITFQRNTIDGSPEGVVITKVANDSVFSELGFQEGDILLAVDEAKMMIQDDASEIYEHLLSQEKVTFTYERNGNSHSTVFDKKVLGKFLDSVDND